jgi:tRNA G18 (ribose-2'-O)-methylase SpoU
MSVDSVLTQTRCAAPKIYLVITNISKRTNVRALLQTAAAFGCEKILVVGQRSFDFSPTGKDLPKQLKAAVAAGSLKIVRFEKWNDCVTYLKEREILLVGVEIHEDAKPIEQFSCQDKQDVAFLMGNEGTGLHDKQLQSCDAFVRIPQYGGGTASLNVYVAASIILHSFQNYRRRRLCQQDASNE